MRTWPVILSLMGCAIFASDAPPVNHKDLAERYSEYSGKRITITGEVASDAEMTVMYLPSADDGSATKEGMLITLSEEASKRPDVLGKRFAKDLKKTGRVTAILEGRFEGALIGGGGINLAVAFAFKLIVSLA